MNQYETIFICKPDLPPEKLTSITEKVKSIINQSDGRVTHVNEWGKKRLAYVIKKQEEGFYILVDYVSEGNAPKKIESYFAITEDVIRHLSIRKEKAKKNVNPVKTVNPEEKVEQQPLQNEKV